MTAWGILGTVWTAVEDLTEAVADAAEVRCAFLLGSGQPQKAKLSAHKSIFLGIFLSLFLSSIALMCGEDLPTWFTNDPALQHIIKDLIPLFALGNCTLTVGTICWTLLGSQGRYRLSTTVACVASWFITLPLAAIFTFVLRIDLQGQVAAVVIGYMVSGTVNSYFLFRSDWNALCQAVLEANEHEQTTDSDCTGSNESLGHSETSQKQRLEAKTPTQQHAAEKTKVSQEATTSSFIKKKNGTEDSANLPSLLDNPALDTVQEKSVDKSTDSSLEGNRTNGINRMRGTSRVPKDPPGNREII